ncbi:MAG: hypothetical protein HYV25_03110 [Candidatus Harrisonbacteria bacterium]|nr:hypothetical protein [Candidatus Harrisonbacteria bacterium]
MNTKKLFTIHYSLFVERAPSARAGYLAITVALILSLIILFVSVSLGANTLLARFNRVAYENKKVGGAAARSCGEIALLKLRGNPDYVGNETVYVGGYPCAILPIEIAGANKVIKTKATVAQTVTNLKLTVDANKLQQVSLEELQTLP